MGKIKFGNLSDSFGLKKAFRKDDFAWKEVLLGDVLSMPLWELLGGRFLLELEASGFVCRVSTHKEDYLSLKSKYPKDLAVSLHNIKNILDKLLDDPKGTAHIFKAVSILDAEVYESTKN